MKAPFKFLDAYNKKDKEFFFGREKDVATLYDFVNKNRVVLIYGPSGSGKTSVIQCGLGNKFEVTDWMPFYIRRGDDINKSILEALSKIEREPHSDGNNLVKEVLAKMERITQRYLRPVYLILDQFEEVLIIGSESEKKCLIELLRNLLKIGGSFDCHILIVMREEFLAWLDEIEIDIPGLSDRRMRIEPMWNKDVKEVLINTLKYFNIKLDSEDDVDQIITEISDKKGNVLLPYLQVYLSKFWEEDFKRSYPDGYTGNQKYPPLTFTKKEIERFGEIKNVLTIFLTEQKERILKEIHEDSTHQTLNEILNEFVSDAGTKMPVMRTVEGETVHYTNVEGSKLFENIDPGVVSQVLDLLEDAKIIKEGGGYTLELYHDILAKLIYEQKDNRQKNFVTIKHTIKVYRENGDIIPYKSIQNWEAFPEMTDLPKEDFEYFEKCKKIGEDQIENEIRLKEREKNRKWKNRLLLLVGCVIALAIFIVFMNIHTELSKRKDNGYSWKILRIAKDQPDKLNGLNISNRLWRYMVSKDSGSVGHIQKTILDLAQTGGFDDVFAIYEKKLKNPSSRVRGYEVEISATGNKILYKNDNSQFVVTDLDSNNVNSEYTLGNVDYAYFLGNSDDIVYVLQHDDSKHEFIPNNASIHKCCGNELTDFPVLPNNKTRNFRSVLYDKDFMVQKDVDEMESYKMRLTESGRTILPYQGYSRFEDTNWPDFLRIVEKNGASQNFEIAEHSIISSPLNNAIMFFTTERNGEVGYVLKILYDSLQKAQVISTNVDFAQFAEDGGIIYLKGRNLYFLNRSLETVDSIPAEINVDHVFMGENGGLAFLIDRTENKLQIWNFETKECIIRENEEFIGFNVEKNRLMTYKSRDTGPGRDTSTIYLKPFVGKDTIYTIPNGIDEFKYNIESNNVLILSKKDPETNRKVLYLLDDSLRLKATFCLTPNDAFGFGAEGKFIFFIRDDELRVFPNKKGVDVTSIGDIIKTLDSLELKNGVGLTRRKIDSIISLKKKDTLFPSELPFTKQIFGYFKEEDN